MTRDKDSELVVEDDGLACSDVGPWAKDKYRLVSLYSELFSSGMKNKWQRRVYVDLYSGAGYSRIQGTSTVLMGSPLLALKVRQPFDKYIFCEADSERLSALRIRAERIAPSADISYITGNCDSSIDEISDAIPKHSLECKVLSLCFVDPFDFGLKFRTLEKLSNRFMDFLVLLAVGMDANRNYEHYLDNNPKIDEALGNTEWRQRWKVEGIHRSDFRHFLAKEFAASMNSLGFLPQDVHQMKEVRSDLRNLPLYYLALFSRHETAYKFWDEVRKYCTDQTSFWG